MNILRGIGIRLIVALGAVVAFVIWAEKEAAPRSLAKTNALSAPRPTRHNI
jgi:hypothetical protein